MSGNADAAPRGNAPGAVRLAALLAAAGMLGGCAVASVAGTVVSTTVSVAGTAVSTTADVVGGAVDLAIPDDDDD